MARRRRIGSPVTPWMEILETSPGIVRTPAQHVSARLNEANGARHDLNGDPL